MSERATRETLAVKRTPRGARSYPIVLLLLYVVIPTSEGGKSGHFVSNFHWQNGPELKW
jgi:hypothetical protein